MKRAIRKVGGAIAPKPEPPTPPPPQLTDEERVQQAWETMKASLPPHTSADSDRARSLLAPVVWPTTDMSCDKCTGAQVRLTGCYTSCKFVQKFDFGTGKLEKLQCDFIWWCLFVGVVTGTVAEGLTLKTACDIIPPAMLKKLDKLKSQPREAADKAADAMAERYESYLIQMRDWLISENLTAEGAEYWTQQQTRY